MLFARQHFSTFFRHFVWTKNFLFIPVTWQAFRQEFLLSFSHREYFQYPTAKTKSKKNFKIACQLQATIWLGKASDQDDFDFNTRGKVSVYADTVMILKFLFVS